jgi:hypothetical protein
MIVPTHIVHDRFLPNPLQFIIHVYFHPTLYNPDIVSVIKQAPEVFSEILCKDREWIELAQETIQWMVFLKKVMDPYIRKWNFLSG